jgi:hypothetical protein
VSLVHAPARTWLRRRGTGTIHSIPNQILHLQTPPGGQLSYAVIFSELLACVSFIAAGSKCVLALLPQSAERDVLAPGTGKRNFFDLQRNLCPAFSLTIAL